eukprot:CAMPEP_0202084024 /NCGR_PEP_ID=MMETSP0964-20121228/26186_1 /ASSEMBLY_ACC=CAM_ASM_000500 /TAXON_ID=4773 /ORGANISM="Schizochytrium aggregatum, Strain ATCC28209" /LENGTH=62 /DNA_ID=CAMNT_0048651777 /DNA_START=15 /DNA_END=200 /DNA_ORIENTATION=-
MTREICDSASCAPPRLNANGTAFVQQVLEPPTATKAAKTRLHKGCRPILSLNLQFVEIDIIV